MGAAAIAYKKKDVEYTGPVLMNCSVTKTSIEFFFNDSLLGDDAVTVFGPVDPVSLEGMAQGATLTTQKLCANFPNVRTFVFFVLCAI